jgi:hypothetical protein
MVNTKMGSSFRALFAIGTLILGVAVSASATALPITILSSLTGAGVRDGPVNTTSNTSTTIPTTTSLMAVSNATTSTTRIDWQGTSDQVVLDFQIEHVRSASANGYAHSF